MPTTRTLNAPVSTPAPAMADVLDSLPFTEEIQAALLRRLIEAGLPVASFAAAKSDLQDAYLTLLKDNRARGHALPPPAAAPTAPAARP